MAEKRVEPGYTYPRKFPLPVSLIGAGGIGSNLLPLLMRLGLPLLKIWDDDLVEGVNLEMQLFRLSQIGREKSYALRDLIKENDYRQQTKVWNCRFVAAEHCADLDGVIVVAVDSMKSRREAFAGALQAHACSPKKVPLYIDGRLSRKFYTFFDLYTIPLSDARAVEAYKEWLFGDEEVERHPRPEGKISGHVPYILAGFIVEMLRRWTEGESLPWKATFDARSLHAVSYDATQPEEETI